MKSPEVSTTMWPQQYKFNVVLATSLGHLRCNVSLASQPLFLVKGVERKKTSGDFSQVFVGRWNANYLSFPRLFVTFADVCSQLLLANRTRTSSEASPALLLSLLDSHIRSMMS